MPTYTNKVVWKGEHRGYTYCGNGTEMDFSAPPTLYGHPNRLTPEDADRITITPRLQRMARWVTKRFKLELVSLECLAEGDVEEYLDKTSWFRKVVLHPKIVVRGSSEGVVKRALQMARKYSTIAESVKSELVIQPEIEIIP